MSVAAQFGLSDRLRTGQAFYDNSAEQLSRRVWSGIDRGAKSWVAIKVRGSS